MGRRALRKADPAVDLSQHLWTAEQLVERWQAGQVFTRPAPLEVEVGSGKGLFLSNACQANLDHNYLGIEIAKRYAAHAAERLAKPGRTNAKMICGDAQPLFAQLFPTSTLAAVHVYFPDPWWKARHKKRRVLNETFLRDVARVLSPGGTFHFWTDVQEYSQTTLELLAEIPQLQGPLLVEAALPAHDMDYRTHFERRSRLAEAPVYRSQFIRVCDG